MITGDHRETGVAVASTLGLLAPGDEVLTGATLDGMDDAALEARVAQVAVYARVSAEHKLRIVRAWKRRGAIVAMTGDGVNDAPALKEADIGVAMGRTGTAVARESADLVVTDDNFASIVAAVAEGRGIYENIRKAVLYLLSCNLSEVLTMLIAVVAGWPLPLLPLQILWLNLVTDSLPALALGLEPPEPGLMQRPPRDPREPLIDRGRLRTAGRQALFMAAGALALFALARGPLGLDLDRSRALAFTGLVFSQLAHALNSRSERLSLLALGPLTNPALLGAVGLAVALQVLITVVPLTAEIFHVAPDERGGVAAGDGRGAAAARGHGDGKGLEASTRPVTRSASRWRPRDSPCRTWIVAVLVGVVAGLGGYTFVYARGYSYLTNDPGGLRQLPRDERAVRRLDARQPSRRGGVQRLPHAGDARRQVRHEGLERLLALVLLHDGRVPRSHPDDAPQPAHHRGVVPEVSRRDRLGDSGAASADTGDVVRALPRVSGTPAIGRGRGAPRPDGDRIRWSINPSLPRRAAPACGAPWP